MWVRSEKKKKMDLRLLGWTSPMKIIFLWRRPRFISWTWHQYSLFPSIQLHPCRKRQWSYKNMSSLHKKTNKNQPLEENLTWYLYKMIRNHSPWNKKVFPTKSPLISGSSSQYYESALNGREHIPRFSQSLELHNLCHNCIIYCWFLFNIDPLVVGSRSLNYLLLQISITCPIFSQYSTKINNIRHKYEIIHKPS